jgi:hypothetical protein
MKGGTVGPWVKDMTERLVTDEELSWATFVKEFKASFGDPNPAGTARRKMDLLKQGTHTADEYVASFNELKKDTGYNDAALVDKFEKGLNSALVDKIYSLPDMPTNLKDWIKWATKLDRQWRQREAQKKLATVSKPQQASSGVKSFPRSSLPPPRTFQPTPVTMSSQTVPVTKEPDVVPMEIDSGWKKVKSITCYKCRQSGHIARNCPSNNSINSVDYDSFKAQLLQDLEKEGYAIIKKESAKEAPVSNKEDF